MLNLVIATRNLGKLKEFESLLSGFVDKVKCLADFPGLPETIEDGSTFAENALKKAREAAQYTGCPVLADDSGLVVDALDGRPGVYSARFAGENGNDTANNLKLLSEMKHITTGRTAAFVCALAFVTPEGLEQIFTGRINGTILFEERGCGGFGYDPLFMVDGFERTMAELSIAEKNQISHRGQALKQFRNYLEKMPDLQ